eukprot:scaffold43790_cov38-Cyclotella_meneghiniana.AAC.11
MIKGQVPDNWADLYHNSRELATEEKFDLAKSWFRTQGETPDCDSIADNKDNVNPFEVGRRPPRIGEQLRDLREVRPSTSAGEFAPNFLTSDYEGDGNGIREQEALSLSGHGSTRAILPSQDTELLRDTTDQNDHSKLLQMPTCINLHESGLRRSVRIKELEEKKCQHADGTSTKNNCAHVAFGTVSRKVAWLGGIYALLTSVQLPNRPLPPNPSLTSRIVNKFHECNELFDGTINHLHNYALATDLSNNEVFTLTQAMRQDDREQFLEAMMKEFKDHEERDHWDLFLRSTVPRSAKTIKAIWSFKRKRFPDGTLNKHKARLCAHGGMQQWGENYWETYSSVVNMLTVRLILAIAHIHKLDSKSIDFVLAFPQAELNVDIWMELPIGM